MPSRERCTTAAIRREDNARRGHRRQAGRVRVQPFEKKILAGKVIFTVTNRGAIPHTFKICSSPKGGGHANTCKGKGTKTLSPRKTAKLTYVFKKKGTYEYSCTIAGHAAAGMKGDLKVT